MAAVIIFMGAQFSAGLAWDLADVLMGIMALINVPSCLIMGKTACKALVDYRNQKSEGKNPVFHAADIHIYRKILVRLFPGYQLFLLWLST